MTPAAMELWLREQERKLREIHLGLKRGWAAVPRKPDSYAGGPLMGEDFIVNRGDAGDCHEGFNDFPMWCAPPAWKVALGTFGLGGWVGSPPYIPVTEEKCLGISTLATHFDAFAYQEYTLERVAAGEPSFALGNGSCRHRSLELTDYSDGTGGIDDRYLAVWRAEIEWPASRYSHPNDPQPADVVGGVVELVLYETADRTGEASWRHPYAQLCIGWILSDPDYNPFPSGNYKCYCCRGVLPSYSGPTDTDYDSPNTSHTYIYRSRKPLQFSDSLSGCFQIFNCYPVYGGSRT